MPFPAAFSENSSAPKRLLVSAMPSGPGPIPEELIARIAARVPAPTETFLLTALRDAEAIAEQHRKRSHGPGVFLPAQPRRGFLADRPILIPERGDLFCNPVNHGALYEWANGSRPNKVAR